MTPKKPTSKLLNAAAAKADRAEMERLPVRGAGPNGADSESRISVHLEDSQERHARRTARAVASTPRSGRAT